MNSRLFSSRLRRFKVYTQIGSWRYELIGPMRARLLGGSAHRLH